MDDPVIVPVPLLRERLELPSPKRVRELKKHLIRSLRALRVAKRPERLIQPRDPAPTGFTGQVLRAGCATCKGHCCKGGGEHAYLDERTMARVRHENPDHDARGIIGLYLARLPPVSYQNSCLYHGPGGCTLGRGLRAELCNVYYCNGLRDFQKLDPVPARVRVVAARDGEQRRSAILLRDPIRDSPGPVKDP